MQQRMRQNRFNMRVIAFTLTALAMAAMSISSYGQGTAQKGASSSQNSQAAASGAAGSNLHQTMMRNMQQMQTMPMSGDNDRDFAATMRAHHQGAIDMSEVELRNGADPDLKEMARKSIASQKKEIEELDRWLAKHGSSGAMKK